MKYFEIINWGRNYLGIARECIDIRRQGFTDIWIRKWRVYVGE